MQKVIGKNVIGFVGLSHLGLNYLAASVEKKFNVIGVDLNQKLNDFSPSSYSLDFDRYPMSSK